MLAAIDAQSADKQADKPRTIFVTAPPSGTEYLFVALFFIVTTVAMTWPLAPDVARAVSFPGDPFINTWILDWDWYATFHRPLALFNANIFYPAKYSLALSENLYGIALVLFPLRALGATPIVAYNIGILIGFAFSGFAAYLLGRYVTGSTFSGVAAGAFYAFVPFRFTHLPHIQHVWGGWLPLLLLSVLMYARRPTWRAAALFGTAFLFNGLSNIHALLFATVAIAFTLLALRPPLLRLLTCTAIALLILAPFLYPYYAVSKLYNMERHWIETMGFSARPADWLTSNSLNRLYVPLHKDIDPERCLFPGVLSLIVAGVGLAAARSRSRQHALVAMLWVAIGFLGSVGLHTFFHRFLFQYVSGFRAIRVPARWAMIAYIGLALLIALGTGVLAKRTKWAGAVITILLLLELRSAPLLWYMAVPDVPPVYQWIRTAKLRAVMELPAGGSGDESSYMLRATAHHRPIVNGWSGFGPPEYERLVALSQQNPIPDEFTDELKRIGCDIVIVHANAATDAIRSWVGRELARGRIAYLRHFDAGLVGDWVFAVGKSGAASTEVQAFLAGKPVYSESTLGALFQPPPATFVPTPATFSGFAFSPYGIQKVDLLFNSGRVREHTSLRSDPPFQRAFHWYDATQRPVFFRTFERWPKSIWDKTDVQTEITDGRGQKTLLEDRFIRIR